MTPWTTTHQTSLSITNYWSVLKLISMESVMPSNHLILYCPLLLLPSIFPNMRFFQMSQLFTSVQFSSATQLCPTLCDPMNGSTPGLLSITNSRCSLRVTSLESVMPSSHLILCRSPSPPAPIPPSIRVFSNESTLRMRWPKYWSSALVSFLPKKSQG